LVSGTEYCWVNFAGAFTSSYGADTDSADNIYITDRAAGVIKKITPAGTVSPLDALTGDLVELAVNKINGNLYFLNYGSGELKKSVPPYTSVTVHASGFSAGNVIGLGVDSTTDTVYVGDIGTDKIMKITSAGVVTTLAGSGTQGFLDNTNLASAQFHNPCGIAVVGSGDTAILYVMDRENHAVRKIDIAGDTVTTVAGNGTLGCTDGAGPAAQFHAPTGIQVGPDGNFYIADQANGSVRKMTPDGVVTTIGGNCAPGTPADGCGSVSRFGTLGQVAVDSTGHIYTADRDSDHVEKGTPPTSSFEVQIDFTGDAADTAGQFTLQSSSNANGTYADVSATITTLGTGSFRAVVAANGGSQFYRIKR
jgi:hypothetical protein